MAVEITKEEVFAFHEGGKVRVALSKPLETQKDLCLAYTPGVAQAVKEIAAKPETAFSLTSKRNLVAVVSDGTAILVHVIYHVLHEGKVGLAFRRKFSVFIEPLVFHKVRISGPIRRIRRIGNLNSELHVTEIVMLKRIAVVDVEIAIRNATQDHVHSGEVVGSGGQFLSIVVSHIRVILEAQQQRAGTTSRIGSILYIGQAEASKTAEQFSRT